MSKKISKDEVQKLAELARIDLADDEIKDISESSGGIFDMIDHVKDIEVDSADIKRDYTLKNVMRNDVEAEKQCGNRKEIMDLFPDKKNDYLRVKKILSN